MSTEPLAMSFGEALADPQELRRCMRDLVVLATLPAVWRDHDSHQIADSVAVALVAMLDAEFVYVVLPGRRDEPMVEVTRTGRRAIPDVSGAVHWAMLDWLPRRAHEDTAEIPNPLAPGTVRIAYAPIGFAGDAALVAACREPGFPTELQRLLLEVATNQAAIAVQRWHAETDEQRFAALVERSSDLIGFASLEGRRHYLNPAGRALVGLGSLEEARLAHVLDFVVPAKQARVRDEIWPLVLRDGRWTGEIHLRHVKTGAAIPFLVDWFRIDHPRTGRPMNIATISRDLTVQKQAEADLRGLNETLEQRVGERTAELAEANQKLVTEILEREHADARLQELQSELFHAARLSTAGQMAAALAHEINQPLTAITNSINAARRLLARDEPGTLGTVREVINEAAGEVLRAGLIVHRLRDFVSRGETDKRIDSVVTMVEEACALALTSSEALGVEVRIAFDPNAAHALADRIQIQQVLTNLIRNALEAMVGSKRRTLAVTTAAREGGMIGIAVADSGPGVPSHVMEHLFQPFVSTKRHGMGLGLSICRSIVEAHGGKLWCEPNSNGGATFSFTLAAAPGNDANDVE